ncbi:CPBP family intramembrane glutamic endopeptidase [Metabacillus malikii]|uniref:Membrane protease YdiL (CAAX protease family) n=1 Tax=Metabacillus malikii TaxID=1504265 RepID=A0ABT9ZIT1_9BACI|nr:CPBP family intramembrane glutamic endopeptidase [Metabacillus malikii]MDQ0232181.1 membrane protease YdiL (CAAX protease family) [Metabacillus malikii]
MLFTFYMLFLCFLLTYEPIWGYISYQRFKRDLLEKPEETNRRTKYYKDIMIGLWLPAIVILIVVALSPLSYSSIGITMPTFNTSALGKWPSIVILVLFLVYVVALIYQFILLKMSEQFRQKVASQFESMPYQEILPQSPHEKKLWGYVSLTAGVTEEIIYRGFLLFVFIELFPELSVWLHVVLAGILFGLAHTYQGISGVVRTAIVGIFFGLIYFVFESIIPLIIFHFLLDYVAKAANNEENL